MKFDRHLNSSAADMPVKFENDTITVATNLAASRTSQDLAISRRTAEWLEPSI